MHISKQRVLDGIQKVLVRFALTVVLALGTSAAQAACDEGAIDRAHELGGAAYSEFNVVLEKGNREATCSAYRKLERDIAAKDCPATSAPRKGGSSSLVVAFPGLILTS